MLTTVLCRFSVPIGKYFLKITQHYSPRFLDRKWLASSHAHTPGIPDDMFCYRLNSREKLIKAMLLWSSYGIAPGLKTKSAMNFFHKRLRIILLLGNKTSLRNHFQINEGQNLLLERQEALTQIVVVRGIA